MTFYLQYIFNLIILLTNVSYTFEKNIYTYNPMPPRKGIGSTPLDVFFWYMSLHMTLQIVKNMID